MAWTAFKRSQATGNALSETEARVRRAGSVVVPRNMAEAVGLSDRALVLYDLDTARLGFRKPEASEMRDAVRIKPEGDPKTVGQRFVAIECRPVFKAAGWLVSEKRPAGKKPRLSVRWEGRKQVYTRAASAEGPGMLVVKLDDDRPEPIEDGCGDED